MKIERSDPRRIELFLEAFIKAINSVEPIVGPSRSVAAMAFLKFCIAGLAQLSTPGTKRLLDLHSDALDGVPITPEREDELIELFTSAEVKALLDGEVVH